MHQRREYDLLVSEAKEGGQSNAGDTSRESGHGAMDEQEMTDKEEEGYKTLQRALPARGKNGVRDEARGPPELSRALNT